MGRCAGYMLGNTRIGGPLRGLEQVDHFRINLRSESKGNSLRSPSAAMEKVKFLNDLTSKDIHMGQQNRPGLGSTPSEKWGLVTQN